MRLRRPQKLAAKYAIGPAQARLEFAGVGTCQNYGLLPVLIGSYARDTRFMAGKRVDTKEYGVGAQGPNYNSNHGEPNSSVEYKIRGHGFFWKLIALMIP